MCARILRPFTPTHSTLYNSFFVTYEKETRTATSFFQILWKISFVEDEKIMRLFVLKLRGRGSTQHKTARKEGINNEKRK
jgi:hypothetical protein